MKHILLLASCLTGSAAGVLYLAASPVCAQPPALAAAERTQIDAALPARAPAVPRQPRKLLIFGLNVGYPGHGSIRHADYALAEMGRRTGAYESVISTDPAAFRADHLRQFDAVFFNNNVGNLFQDPQLRRNLVEFVYAGGGMLGVHGATVAFTQWPGAIEDWPEFGRMIGGRGANHKDNTELVTIKLDDPTHPLVQPFGGSFAYRDEFFRVHEPYSRDRLRILLSIDVEKTDLNQGGPPRGKCLRADNDYALAWVRSYGRGRTGYCTIAHNPYVFWDPKMLEFYLGLIQFALGDLPAPTTPSARLTAAARAQEQLGWWLEMSPAAETSDTLFDLIACADRCAVPAIGARSVQQVSREIPKPFDHRLSHEERQAIRLRLDDAGVRLLTYWLPATIRDAESCREALTFARMMGAEFAAVTAVSLPLESLAPVAEQCGVRICLPAASSLGERVGRGVGHTWDLAPWQETSPQQNTDMPADASRVFACQLPANLTTQPQSGEASPEPRLPHWLATRRDAPLVFRIPCASVSQLNPDQVEQVISWFHAQSLQAR